ncbi:cell division protein ZipA C-terminal FtsZ-binding domain-containing protein [Methylotenera sp.]|uniref:cell division protein ZipA C-terminal FtsZ-binding domain-containing protein n=1 Tax=Methylotenera sp. TaxID=2051956 RepID=UPI002734EDBE|nr:cell division protein ZipA C-terminal FtsZ-binding domain-containing protein [Methylotenera sp.]MDP3776291.1 cell division protein ZipA C-terminal FtsZ-binding domain-containing protein [Methylotenera sp.]
MNDLQIILIIIGALIIAAVLLFNWWQERKFNQQIESGFSKPQNDALLNNDSQTNALNEFDNDFEEDNFSIDTARLKEHFDLDRGDDRFVALDTIHVESEEDVLDDIDETYSSLVERHEHEHAQLPADDFGDQVDTVLNTTNANTQSAVNLNTKPAQHEEIKAIFNDAFNQASNQASSSLSAAPVVNDAINHVEENVNVRHISSLETMPAETKPADQSKSGVANDVIRSSLPPMLQSQMDLIAVIYLANETSISNITASIGGFFEDYDKPIHLHALVNESEWISLTALEVQPDKVHQSTSKITCSLQLADRAGAVTRSILNRFQLAVETLGLDIDGHVEWQSNGDPLLAASALDAFCIDVDKTMGFHLVHGDNGAFTGTKLRGLSEAQGMVLDTDGTFKYYQNTDDQTAQAIASQSVSFVMFNRDNYLFNPDMLRTSVVKAVTFQLDIPHVMHCTEAFNQMVQVARQMEIGLNAMLVDDNNRPLGDMQIEKIRQQLKVIYATMLVRGIVPGSDSARRLFS